MLFKFFLFTFFSVGCSQVLGTAETVNSDDQNNGFKIELVENNNNSSQTNNTDLEGMQLFMNLMSECCYKSAQNISELEKDVLKLEQIKEDSAKNISKLIEIISILDKEKEDFIKTTSELKKKVSELEEVKENLEKEISENNRWENDMVQEQEELNRRERYFREFGIRLDKAYEEQYRLRLRLNEAKKKMYQDFLQLQDQKHQVSECMNHFTMIEEENNTGNNQEKYQLTEEKGKNFLYKCTSISDVERNYLYKCLPSLNADFIP